MQDSYWSKFAGRRIGRRRALAATGSVAAAAAFLAACGGDDDDGGGTTGGSTGGGATPSGGGATPSGGGGGAPAGLVTAPTYSAPAQATRGGLFKNWSRSEPRTLDPFSAQAGLNDNAEMVYEALLDEKPGKLGPSSYELEGRLAESWEVSADGLQYTFKLRKDAKWHNIAPVNGRAFDAEDAIFSMKRYAAQGALGTTLWASAGAGGPMMDPTAPDANTVVIKLTEPVSYMINYFAPFGGFTATQVNVPRETDDTFDIDQGMIGTGPYQLSRHEPSVTFEYERFADYYDPDHGLVDSIQMPIVPEYASRLAQLQAGEVHVAWDYAQGVRATDILALKNDQPDILLYEGPKNLATSVFTFGTQGTNEYKDERVRQAISMSIDRDLQIDVTNNIEEFAEAGIPLEKVWNTHLTAYDPNIGGGWWLDPQSSDFGENAKYFQYNVPEAKKLLTAAGYPDGFEAEFRYPNASNFDRQNVVEPYFFFLQEIGLTIKQNNQTEYTTEYIPENRDASGAYPGIGWHSVTGGVPSLVSPVSALAAEHLPSSGVPFHGYSVDGGTGKTGDPALIEILNKARVSQDTEEQKTLIQEAQRYLGKAMWNVRESGGSGGLYAAWPAVQNFMAWQQLPSSKSYYQTWLDPTKKPIA